MSETVEESQGPLHSVDTYSGKLYWLNPPSGKTIDLESLKNDLQNRTFQEDITGDFEDEDIIVPSVFERDGQMVKTTTTEDVKLINYNGSNIITGKVVLDDVDRIVYRDQLIFVLDTTEAEFLIFEGDDFFYFCVLAKRKLAETVVETFREEFTELGSIINQTRLGSGAISDIGDRLDAVLMDTIITDYDQNEITQTRIQGESYEDTEVYDTIDSDGSVKSHLFQTDELVPDETKTILIGRDGLVRIYSNATLRTYLTLVKSYVIPEVHRDVESSPSVGAWEAVSNDSSDSIFKDI